MSIRKLRKEIVNRIRQNPETSGLRYKDFGKSKDFQAYSGEEIEEMYYGIYRNSQQLLVDGDYFINMNDVIQTGCTLETVIYYKKPTKEVQETITSATIQNIRTFYVKDYFLITENQVAGTKKHDISSYLWKTGAIKIGRNNFSRLFRISSQDKVLQDFKGGLFPKDLYDPIKTNINQLFFDDDDRISDFIVVSDLRIGKS